jgi:AraC family transcriptional regulator, positive regulator of tynA and feaB
MQSSGDFFKTTELNYEQWRDALRPNWGLYTPDDTKGFVGRVRTRNICGFNASDITSNSRHCERTHRDIRLDGVDHWYAVFQIAGGSTILQNDHPVELGVGDWTLIDSARPVTYVNGAHEQWLSLQLPRRPLLSHLGFEPQISTRDRTKSQLARLLFQLVVDAAQEEDAVPTPVGTYMQLAIYDLLGAVFAPSSEMPVSARTDKLFNRICQVIMDRFTNPDLGPREVAAEEGISLRYLQKLFTERDLTCSHFIESVRLDHAADLLDRRALLSTAQPLSAIAYASGFADYTNFARKFRRRFGYAPGAHAGKRS